MKFNLRNVFLVGITFLTILTFDTFYASPNPAFTPFQFVTQFSSSGTFTPSQDILLEAVVIKGKRENNFQLVQQVEILENANNLQASVRGPDNPQDPLVGEGPSSESPTARDLTASLANLNLSSLVNISEAEGRVVLEIAFAQPVQSFCFWERGANSDVLVEAIAQDGKTILASYKISRNIYQDAGYSLLSTGGNFTTPNPQGVGAIGLSLQGALTSRLRLTSKQPRDNGPDLKIVALIES